MYNVTINGQLFLLMLIEDLELAGFHVISANTDGVVARVETNRLDEYYKVCKDWSKRTKFNLEYTTYTNYIRTTVNDYLTVKEDGKTKAKGDFISDIQIDKGYYAPAIAKSLYEYYVNDNKDLDTIIRQYKIYDYCISIKVGSQFKSELHSIKNSKKHVEVLQKDNRYFVSNTGGVFLKHQIENNTFTNVIKGNYITIFNTYYDAKDYNINYRWYKQKVNNIINKINNTITKDMKKTSGSMFDEI